MNAMRKLLLFCLMLVCWLGAMAQPSTRAGAPPPPVHYSASFASQHGETFSVYIDGELQNRLPQSRVLVNEISDQTHEVVVVLKRPADKAAVLMLRPGERMVTVNVNYDSRLEQLYLYTAAHNRPEAPLVVPTVERRLRQGEYGGEVKPLAVEPVADVRRVTADELDSMIVRMRSQSFDNDRLALGKVIVASSHLTAVQIARLAETIDFSNSQVDFLKYSYSYCIDPANYYRTVDVLTFSVDKKKVLDYIATQR